MKKIILLLSIVLLVASCSKFLDIIPVGKLIPREIEEFNSLLYNTKTINSHLAGNGNGSVLTGLSDMVYMSDNVIKYHYSPTSTTIDRMAGYVFSAPYIDFNKPDDAFDKGCYRAVNIFNNVIDGIATLGKSDDPFGKEVVAQARAGRAWSLFVTGISYGPTYDPTGKNDGKTIPYRTVADPGSPNPNLATIAELYNLVQKDLEFAAEFAPKMTENPVRANRATANALLAFMYMNKNDYQNMYKYSKIAWDMQLANYGGRDDQLLYNYNDFKYETRTPLPVVQPGEDVQISLLLESPDKLHSKSYNKENMFYRASMTSTYVYPTKEYLNLFKSGDRRYELFFLKSQAFKKIYKGAGPNGTNLTIDDGIVLTDYRRAKLGGSYNLGITHPELLLMLAESAARTERPSEAMQALKILRKYRYTVATASISDLTGDALIQEILNERLRELPISSPHRFWDLKRFSMEQGKPWSKKSITRVVLGETLSVDIKSNKYQLEIGNSYRINNPQWNLELIPGSYNPYKYGNPFD